jgi:hypothetical protein
MMAFSWGCFSAITGRKEAILTKSDVVMMNLVSLQELVFQRITGYSGLEANFFSNSVHIP